MTDNTESSIQSDSHNHSKNQLPPLPSSAQPLDCVYRLKGKVVGGFKRGSKQLGFPTANLDPAAFRSTLVNVPRGVYIGWAQIEGGPVYPTVLSLGLNPHFQTKEETVEAYILHEFEHDFYDQSMQLLIFAFIRPSYAFTSLQELIDWIQNDVEITKRVTQEPQWQCLRDDTLFSHAAISSTS